MRRQSLKARRVTAYHEAGHAVASYFVDDIPVACRITIARDEGDDGRCDLPSSSPSTVSEWIADAILSLCGPYAEDKWRDDGLAIVTSQPDYESAWESILEAANHDEENAQDLLREVEQEACELVQSQWASICAVAEMLLRCQTITRGHLVAAIEEAESGR